jgi:hypothetical protein
MLDAIEARRQLHKLRQLRRRRVDDLVFIAEEADAVGIHVVNDRWRRRGNVECDVDVLAMLPRLDDSNRRPGGEVRLQLRFPQAGFCEAPLVSSLEESLCVRAAVPEQIQQNIGPVSARGNLLEREGVPA